MHNLLITPSTARILQRSAKLAQMQEEPFTRDKHLLWAILLDESQAAELLRQKGFTLKRFQEIFKTPTVHTDDFAQKTDSSDYPNETAATTTNLLTASQLIPQSAPQFDQQLQTVMTNVKKQVEESDIATETNSEHLLFGLLTTESNVATILQNHGLHPEMLTNANRTSTASEQEPVPIDFDIQWKQPTKPLSTRNQFSTHDQQAILRILDAAANRAREGTRVLEDFTRFLQNSSQLTEQLKNIRHEISQLMQSAFINSATSASNTESLLAARNTETDVGTTISTHSETIRHSTHDVITANFKRVQEALRTLEEFGKCFSPEIGERCKQLRYRTYTIEKQTAEKQTMKKQTTEKQNSELNEIAANRRQQLANCSLYLLLTKSACRQPLETLIQDAISAGVGAIQIREKEMNDHELLAHLHQIRELTRNADILFFVNDRPDLAVLCDADGVHLGQDDLPVSDARKIVGSHRLIGLSTHSITQARDALKSTADYLGIGPVFPSHTKQFQQFPGLKFVEEAAAEITRPWFAIGGIDPTTLPQAIAAGAHRIAVSHCISQSETPLTTAQKLLAQLPAP